MCDSAYYTRLFYIACAVAGVSLALNWYLATELLARDIAAVPASEVMQLEPTEIRGKGPEVYEL